MYCEDARWLVEQRGGELAAAGWALCDLFEILPGHRDGGGLAEVLCGSRFLTINGLRAKFTRRESLLEFTAAGGPADYSGWVGRAPWQPPATGWRP